MDDFGEFEMKDALYKNNGPCFVFGVKKLPKRRKK